MDNKPSYKIGLPNEGDTPQDIETRDRMWAGIQQAIRKQETWAQWARRMVRKVLR